MIKRFTVLGEPKGKQRPRFGNGRTYTPKQTAEYESLVQREYVWQAGKTNEPDMFPKGTALAIEIVAFFGIPKSTTKAKRLKMLKNEIRPLKKPDADNIAKIICDALNGTAYADDAQIAECCVMKYYSEIPCVSITISEA